MTGWTDVRVPVVIATGLVGHLGLDLLIDAKRWHLSEEHGGVCLEYEVQGRKKAMNLQ